jgi:hypothetical protein
VTVPSIVFDIVLLRFGYHRPALKWLAPVLASIAIAALAGYGAHALSRDQLEMELTYSLPIAALTGGLILYWLTR